MTKKDYEMLAGVFRSERQFHGNQALDVLEMNLADTLAFDNPRFDRARFLAACRGEDSQDSAGRKVRYAEVKFLKNTCLVCKEPMLGSHYHETEEA